MKKQNIVLVVLLSAFAFICQAQNSNEFTIPLSDPAKRGKIKAHLNSGSITIKGTARKDVLVKYKSAKDEDGDRDRERKGAKEGLKRIGGGGLELEASENSNMVKVSSGSWNVKTDLEMEIPTGMDVQMSS